jgi:hypothetical protein
MLAIKFVETSLQPIGEPIRRNVGSVERRAASCGAETGIRCHVLAARGRPAHRSSHLNPAKGDAWAKRCVTRIPAAAHFVLK